MRKYYFSIEDNKVISIYEIKKIWNQFGKNDFPVFADYIAVCSYLQNGDLMPIETEIKRQSKKIDCMIAVCDCESDIQAEVEYLNYLQSIVYETV